MHLKVSDIREEFKRKLEAQEFTTGRGGHQMLEIIGASFLADEEAIFGTVNQEYVKQEIDWYLSESTNVNSIGEKVPAAWKSTANEHGEINSNYGHLIFASKFHTQYYNVVNELIWNEDSRRATMVYTRPSIWVEYNENGKNDFICTNAVTYYLRDNKLHAVVQMRSNDVVFGYKNDFAWQKYVQNMILEDLGNAYTAGDIYWQVQNLHVYERHFHLVK